MADPIPQPKTQAPAPQPEAGQKKPQSGKPRERRRKVSRYGQQMQEKKQLKEIYGIREGQLKIYYEKALHSKSETAPALITLLERRLDNFVYRAGFAQTRPQARQLVTHGYFMINSRRVDIPSYLLKKNDVVTVKESKRSKPFFTTFDKRMQNVRTTSWIELVPNDFGFKFTGEIDTEEVHPGVDMRAIVEFFTR